MTTPTAVADGLVASFHFKLTSSDGEVIDTSAKRGPLSILQGAGNVVEGVEEALAGREVGESFEVVVPPEKAYGEKHDSPLQSIPLAAFPEGAELQPGMQFMVSEDDDSEMITLWVVGLQDDKVIVTRNHPLAGETLHFAITLVGVRQATDEERAHGHPHGPGGHHH